MPLASLEEVSYFFMRARWTHDADVPQKIVLPFCPWGWSSLTILEGGSCATMWPCCILILSICCPSRCVIFLVKRASFLAKCMAFLVNCVVRLISLLWLYLLFSFLAQGSQSKCLELVCYLHIANLGTLDPLCYALFYYHPIALICTWDRGGFKSLSLFE